MRLRICYLGWANHVHLERWAGYFARMGHSVSVISVGEVGRYPAGVRQYCLGMKERGWRWKALKLRLLLARIRPQVVHAHWANFGYIARRAWRGPLVVTAWGSDVYRLGEQGEGAIGQTREALREADLVTCDSADISDRIRELTGFAQEQISIILWGVDTTWFHPRKAPSELIDSLQIRGRPVVLSARNFTPVYNQETVVSAFARVVREVPDVMLLMKFHRGRPDYRRKIEARIAELAVADSVRIVETVPYEQMPDLYRAADVTVSMPLSDATPASLFEAMACGSAPVVSDLSSLREWLVDGENGYLVPAMDVECLAERIVFLLRNPQVRSRFMVRNLKLVEEKAAQRVHMQAMEGLYVQLLGLGAPAPAGATQLAP